MVDSPQPNPPPAADLESSKQDQSVDRDIVKIKETHKTFRFAIVALTIVVGIVLITRAAVALTGGEWNWAKTVAIVGVALIGPAGPCIVVWKMRLRIKAITQKSLHRLSQLEAEVDVHRTSSGLQQDGSTPENLK